MIADALTVQAEFIEAQRAGVGRGTQDLATLRIDCERLAEHRRRKRREATPLGRWRGIGDPLGAGPVAF